MREWIKNLYERKYENQSPHICLPGVKNFISDLLVLIYPLLGQVNFDQPSELIDAFEKSAEKFKIIIKCQSSLGDVEIEKRSAKFYANLEKIEKNLDKDAHFFFESDPACKSIEEVISAYPGFYAIACHRIANVIDSLGFALFARMIAEIAHQKTGIDIHPAANLSTPIFIDHGTGVVIGESCDIGKKVKIYQGVTLGALSVAKNLRGVKRHPTVEDNVIIYSNATILGGETVIGESSTIGGNVWLAESVPANSFVYHDSVKTTKIKS